MGVGKVGVDQMGVGQMVPNRAPLQICVNGCRKQGVK